MFIGQLNPSGHTLVNTSVLKQLSPNSNFERQKASTDKRAEAEIYL
jgi:hypothetical protein